MRESFFVEISRKKRKNHSIFMNKVKDFRDTKAKQKTSLF